MTEVVGVRFKRAGKVYYFDPSGIELNPGDWVVVETGRGLELVRVVISPKQVLSSEITEPLKPLVRKANEEDIRQRGEFQGKEKEALEQCEEMVARLNLPMKMLSAEYNLEGTRLTLFFSAEGRVDFRDLLKELTTIFKTRIELRQVGPRDEAKLLGGIGRCGRPLCCTTYLSEFNPVTIRMAKEQALPLNPMKISGVCGRLLCCLSHECDQYRIMKEKLPHIGQRVITPMGVAAVVGGNPLKETVVVQLESQATVEFPVEEVRSEEERHFREKGA
ncbi:MAG: stage 0 sporulation family protein [Dehalococcoidia bacterium]|nr:stage 0 sporulation family protein [Dehalococcoidia bacterium]